MSFPRYPVYRDSGLTWLGDVPQHWGVGQSRRLFALRNEGAVESDKQLTASQEYGVIYQDDFMQREGRRVVQVIKGADILKHVEPGDFVISMRSFQGGIEYCALSGAISSAYAVLAPVKLVHRPFFRWLFKSRQYIQALQTTSNLVRDGQALRYDNFTQVEVPLVPMDEQAAIARFLDREAAKIDALVEEQKRLIELLKEKRQAVISQVVTKGLDPNVPMKDSGVEWLGEVPASWTVKRIKFLVANGDGIQMGPFGGMLLDLDSEGTGFRVYGQENTISGDFTRGSRWISRERYTNLSSYHIGIGDLLLTRKGSLGNARLVHSLPEPGIMDSDTIRIRVNPYLIMPQFLAFLLHEARYVSEQIDLSKRGAILPGLNSETISNIAILLPPIDCQNSLIRFLEQRLAEFQTLTSDAQQAIELLGERRSALISAAVTGKIDVRGLA